MASARANKPRPTQLKALSQSDPRLGRALRSVPSFPGFPLSGRHGYQSHFHALARTIVYQQLAGAAARTIHDRVARLTPGSRFPRAMDFLDLSDEELRGAGLSRNKVASLRDLSQRVVSSELKLHGIGSRPDEEIMERLVSVRGIGEWSAQMFLMFRLGRLDVMPTGDLGVQEGMRRLDGLEERPGPKELLERSETWRPLRTVAAWVLWRLCDQPLEDCED